MADKFVEQRIGPSLGKENIKSGCKGCSAVGPRDGATLTVLVRTSETEDFFINYNYPDAKAFDNKAIACHVAGSVAALTTPVVIPSDDLLDHSGSLAVQLTIPRGLMQSTAFVDLAAKAISEVFS